MNATSAEPTQPAPSARHQWMAVLARTSRSELEAALVRALEGQPRPAYDWLRRPETGLAMVRGRVGGSGDAFNLGEATVTRATLRLRSANSDTPSDTPADTAIGVACHLGRDKRRAELAALADALLQLPDRHAQLHAQLIEPLAARIAAARSAREQAVASTRVEFFTMVRGD